MTDKNWWEAEYSSKAKPGNWWEADTVSSTVGKKITDSVNSWLHNHKNYVANYQYRTKDRKYTYEDDYVSDPNDWLNTVSQQKKAFDESADSILAYMDRYKGFLDADFVKSVQDTLTGARGQQKIVVDNATADSKWWQNFANEEEYKTAQRYDGYSKKYSGQKYEDIQKALSLLDDGTEEKWWLSQTQYDLYKGDSNYTSKATSGLKSYEAQKIAEREQEEDKTWWERVAENYANSSPDTSLPAANLSIVTAGYRNDTSYREPNEKWSDGERRQFGYLYAEDPNKAYAYAEQVNNQINAKEKYVQQQAVSAWAGQNFGTGTAGTIGAIATAPMGLADYLDDLAEYAGRGTITQKGGLSPFEMGQAAQSGVANKLNEKYGTVDNDKFIFGGKGWGDVYSLGVSAANSLLSAYTLGGTGTLVNFIGQGSASGVDDALSRGATPEQALLYGTIVGAAEGVTEMINADNLLKIGSSATLKNYLLKALNQGIGESIEEGASSLIGNIADNIIMQDKSNFYATVEKLMEDNPGMSEEEAKNKAWVNMVGGMVFDAMGGFATGSGNAMLVGGASTAWDARKGNQKNIDAVKQYGDYTADLIQEGLQSDKKSESYQLAEKYQKQTQGKDGKAGKAMTGFQIRNLVAANDAQFKVEDFREVRNQAKDRLKELGENASEMWPIAELVAKRVTGQELTRKEKSTLAKSQFGAKVAKEMTESAKQNKLTYKSLEERIGTEGRFGVSESGQATVRGTDEAFDLAKAEVVQVGEGQMTFNVGDKEVSAGDIDFADESQSFLVSAVSDIENITPAAANAVMRDIVDTAKPLGAQLNGIDEAYTYGFNGYSVEDLKAGDYAPSLTDKQMMSAYKLGQSARKISDVEADAPIVKMRTAWEAKLTAKQKTEQQKARIESDDVEVYFEDGGNVVKFDEHTGEYDDKRMAAVNTAKFLSKLGIGGKYYFFESYENAAGERMYKDANGNEVEAPNGIYREADGSIHIDLNAGDAGQGTAAYTLGHELGHFVKHQSKKQFKILGDLVTEAFDKSDMSMHDRVVAKQDFLSTKRGHHVTYSEAFEEVVADAMSTMITDGTFHEKIMEIKVKDKGLFNTIKRFFEKMISKFRKAYADLTPDQKDAQDIREMKEMFDKIQTAFAEALVEASENFHAAMESVVEAKSEPISADEILTDGAVVTDGNGEKHSIRSMKHDIAEGKMFEDLKNVCGWTDAQVITLRNQLNALVEYMIPYRDILDMNESYGMEGRRFSPYKPNSDPLYKISMDFSTLCSKRLLTQYVIENLQLRENRPMSAEEQMAIRDMLNEYRKVEKGLQVACAMCYVEAARLKSPKQMQRWLDDPAPLLKDYFGKKNKAFNDSVKEAQANFKESKGYDREAPKKDMKPADVKELNKIGPKMRSQYQLSAEEQAIVDRAKTLPNSTYLTAGNLANLSETDPVIYDAYTAFVRTATRSKSLETDEPYYYGDSMRDNGNGIVVTDSFIEAVNRENGMRFSSWSDWRIQHLLDYITAVIDNSVRGAAMHGYTKFGDEVRVLGKTGMMFNMSGVAGTQTGLNKDGSLNFSDTESIDVNEAIQLRNEFPETAGLQCIGVGDDHITALLRSDIIDYVIPYHVSGLNAALRRMADIHGWKDYTSTQHAAIDKSIKFDNAVDQEHWHEEPVYSEFFVGYGTGMTGIEAMRASAEKYKKMCRNRGLTPKFNQFASEENYWKLLIDRKMINQQTGNLIKQKPVTPTFDFDTIKEVVDRHVQNYDAGLEKRALNHIVENWDTLPQRIKDLKKGNKAKKSVDTLANQTVAAMPKDTGVKKSDRQKWKPNLDSTEWGIVKYTIDSNQGTAITSTCNMFFKKSKGRTLFGIYSTDDSTLLYASREKTAERERLFLEQFLKEYENGNVTDTSAEGLHTWAKAVRVQQNTSTRDDSTYVAPGRSAGDAAVYGRPSRLYSSAALRNVLENIFQKETAGRTGDGVVKNSDRDSTGKELTKEQQEYFADSKVRDKNGNLLVMYHGSSSTEKFTVFERRPMVNGKIYGDGYYFTEEKNEAQKWGSGNLYKVYVDLKNPYYVSDQGEVPEAIVAAARENYGRSYDRLSQDPSWWGSKLTREEYIEKNSRMWRNPDIALISAVDESGIPDGSEASYYGEIARRKTELLRSLGYDGVIVATNRSNRNFREVMAFDSEQIKLTTNKKPTADKDIRYSERDKAPFPWDDADNDTEEDIYSYAARGELENFKGEYKADLKELMFLQMKNELAKENKRKAEEVAKKNQRKAYDQKLKDVSYASTYDSGVMKAITDFRDAWQEFTGDDITELSSFSFGMGANLVENFDNIFAHFTFRDLTYRYNRGTDNKIENGTNEYAKLEKLFNAAKSNTERFYSGLSAEQKRDAYWHNVNGRAGKNKISYSERTGESVSNRHLLANAFEGLSQSSNEYKMIQQYKGYIAELNSLEKKLSEFNQEIRKIRFGTEGARDTEKLARLEDEAKKIAEAINRYDKKLLSLEASEPLRKVIERERKKEAQKTKDHVKEIQQNKKVRAEQAELRHQIRKAVRDLDKLLKHGNKQKNVKEDLQPVVTKALKAADILFTENYGSYDMLRNGIGADLSDAEEELVNTCTRMLRDIDKMPTDGYNSWQARQETEKRLSAKMTKLKDVFARERKRLNNTTVSSILGELADAYASLKDSELGYVQGAYMEPVHEFLKSLQIEVGGAIVKDMTKDQLESVYAAYKMVLTTVRKANELFNKGIKMSREQLGNAVIAEVTKAGGTHGLWTKGEIARSQADWNNTKPVWVANRIGSESFGKLMQGLFEGQYNFAVDIEEAKQFKLSMDQKYKPRNWDAEKLYEFESTTGKKFSLNLQQIMSLYAFSKREQAYSHLLNGGFVFEGNSTVIVDEKGRKKTYIHNGAASYKLNEATLNEIIGSLTKEQKAYVDEMQAYLSDVMGAKGNEVSMKLYGIQMFKEKFYFPLRSSGAYMERAKEAELKKQQGQINLVNSGFTHAVKPQAKNPIILSGFMDVWAEHCNEMSMYHSMVLPMEDFRKVYNYSTVHDDKFDSASVYQTIQDAYGKAATDYIDQLYRELNAGATVDPRETPFKARISKFKKAAVMLSASVVVQQFSSVGRAYALIDPKYFIGTKINSGTSLSAADEMKKYAPVAIIKEMGGFDTGTKGSAKSYIMAEQYGKGEFIQGIKKDEQYRSDLMGYFPAKADEKTWCAIWEAVKRETKATRPKMDVKSEEFLKLAGERFSEVIEKTQVYDSVLARSANMRSKSAFMAMATSFMAEPTTTVNLLEDALRGRSVKKIARAFGAVAVSIVLNNALASVVYAMRDDDEDETFIEKYFQSFASGMIDDINPMSYYPFLKDVYSLFQGYDVERADMSVISDLRDAMKKAVGLIGKDTSEMDEDELAAHWKNVNSVMMSLLDAGCSAFGVPVKNVRRDAKGLINALNTIGKDLTERDTTWLSFWDKVGAAAKDTIPVFAWTKDRSKQDKLYEAILKGDTQYVARLKSGYKDKNGNFDQSKYDSAVRKVLRENDPRIHEAAQAKYNGNSAEYKRIFKEIQKEGKFSFDDIMESINSELNAIKKEVEPASASSNYSSTDFVNAIVLGETSAAKTIREDIIDAKVNNGDTREEAEESFASSVATATRNAFDSGLLNEAGVAEILTAYAGMDDEEADGKINYWSFVKAHPQYRDDLTQSNVEKYHEFAEPAEIPLDVYVQYVNGTKGLETIRDEWGEEVKSKREQVLEVIDSLDLTWRQKDALYLAAGYAESKIMDVPW